MDYTKCSIKLKTLPTSSFQACSGQARRAKSSMQHELPPSSECALPGAPKNRGPRGPLSRRGKLPLVRRASSSRNQARRSRRQPKRGWPVREPVGHSRTSSELHRSDRHCALLRITTRVPGDRSKPEKSISRPFREISPESTSTSSTKSPPSIHRQVPAFGLPPCLMQGQGLTTCARQSWLLRRAHHPGSPAVPIEGRILTWYYFW